MSGGARGIDGAAHAGALQHGVPTVVMLPCGVNVAYPSSHRALFARVRNRGLLVSEVGPGRSAGRALRLPMSSDAGPTCARAAYRW